MSGHSYLDREGILPLRWKSPKPVADSQQGQLGHLAKEANIRTRQVDITHELHSSYGLTGEGIVLLEGGSGRGRDPRRGPPRRIAASVDPRHDADSQDRHPSRSAPNAAPSVRRSAKNAGRSPSGSRNAVDAFDEERGVRVDALVGALFDSPSGAVRNLRRMPEGIDRLLEAWGVLRRDIDREGPHRWERPCRWLGPSA